MNNVIIIGGSKGAIQVIETLLLCNEKNNTSYNIIGLLDDDPDKLHKNILGYEIWGHVGLAKEMENTSIAWGIGSPQNTRIRLIMADKLGLPATSYLKLIHPGSVISSHATIDEGVTIYCNALVSAGVHISKHVCIGMASIVQHESFLDSGVILGSGVLIAGDVKIGSGTYVGQGANIKQGVSIGSNAFVGMGAVVTKDVPDGVVVVGNPARVLIK